MHTKERESLRGGRGSPWGEIGGGEGPGETVDSETN